MISSELENLILAFCYPVGLSNEFFFWKKSPGKVIGVSIFDFEDYEDGCLDDNDIREAIEANNNDLDTHIVVPRVNIEERINIMKDFIAHPTVSGLLKSQLLDSLETIIESNENYKLADYKNGLVKGIEFNSFMYSIKDKQLIDEWTAFYQEKVKILALGWLNTVV